MLTRNLLTLAAVTMLALPAVADGDTRIDLAGTTWRLTSLGGDAVSPTVISTLIVSADSVGGNGGCNTYGGDFEVTPEGIDISQVLSTMMACDGLEQEQAFFAALEAATDFAIVDGNLQLLEGSTVLAELAPDQ